MSKLSPYGMLKCELQDALNTIVPEMVDEASQMVRNAVNIKEVISREEKAAEHVRAHYRCNCGAECYRSDYFYQLSDYECFACSNKHPDRGAAFPVTDEALLIKPMGNKYLLLKYQGVVYRQYLNSFISTNDHVGAEPVEVYLLDPKAGIVKADAYSNQFGRGFFSHIKNPNGQRKNELRNLIATQDVTVSNPDIWEIVTESINALYFK